MKNRKKGFSLVEIITTIAIMAVMAAVLVPNMLTSRRESNVKMDKSAIDNFTMSMVMGLQDSSIYFDAKEIADSAYDRRIVVVCGTNADGLFEIHSLEATIRGEGLVNDASNTEGGHALAALKSELADFINGNVEQIDIQSEYYMEKMQCFVGEFPDFDFKVRIVEELGTKKDVADATTGVGAPGLYRGAYKQDGQWVLPPTTGGSQLHLHSGYNGLQQNSIGDTWKISITGENLEDLFFSMSYYDGSSWPGGGSEVVEIVKNGNSWDIYVKSTVDYPNIAIVIGNGGSEDAIVDNVQFNRVERDD
jgi:prepilin-type N-terminal cleavage/methylation domain-containing protein